jgi:putative ABC transport system substrate-binding protein
MLLGGTAAARPLAARAQQERVRRIGALIIQPADDPETMANVGTFAQALAQLGWTIGGNLQIEYRYGAGNADAFRKYAAELVALAPDVILASGTPSVAALQAVSRSVPIVFTLVTDPVAAGFVDSLARPGGNTTGFMQAEYSFNAKLLELLKQIAPGVNHAAVLRDLANPAGISQFSAIQAAASSLGVVVTPVSVRDAGEIERAVAAFARSPNGGLVVTGSATATVHRELIIASQAARGLPRPLQCHRRRPDVLWA